MKANEDRTAQLEDKVYEAKERANQDGEKWGLANFKVKDLELQKPIMAEAICQLQERLTVVDAELTRLWAECPIQEAELERAKEVVKKAIEELKQRVEELERDKLVDQAKIAMQATYRLRDLLQYKYTVLDVSCWQLFFMGKTLILAIRGLRRRYRVGMLWLLRNNLLQQWARWLKTMGGIDGTLPRE